MAVTLSSISPADTEGNVTANTPVIIELTDTTDMTLSYVEVLLGTTSFTVANGKLDYWSVRTVTGGAYVDDLKSVTFATNADWFTQSGETITITVKYNSTTISTTTFTVTANAPHFCTASAAMYNVYSSAIQLASASAHYFVWNIGVDRVAAKCSYYVLNRITAQGGAYYYVAHPIRVSIPASTVVGTPVSDDLPASTVVQAMDGQAIPASAVVQGYFRQGVPATVVTGIIFRHGEAASAIVGTEILAKLPASAVVYGVLRDCVLEVSVLDDSTRTALTALGVTFS